MGTDPDFSLLGTKLRACRLCGAQVPRVWAGAWKDDYEPILDLGMQPMANNLLDKPGPAPLFPLALYRCPYCHLVQLTYTVAPELLFSEYSYASSMVQGFEKHFIWLADLVTATLTRSVQDRSARVVELGSNDGVFLHTLRDHGVEGIGVESAGNLANIANARGLRTINRFFDAQAVDEIGEGTADAVVACNVMAHIPDIHEVMRQVRRVLRPEGLLVVEVQYFRDMVEKALYDNCYFEHYFYWTVETFTVLLASHGFSLLGAQRIPTHGGSIRFWAARQRWDAAIVGGQIGLLREEHEALTPRALEDFQGKVRDLRGWVQTQVNQAGRQRVAAYGAAAKATTMLNYLGLGPGEIEYVVDESPLKIGKWIPGVNIPIVGPSTLQAEPPDVLLITAWNWADQIKQKTAHLGARYIVPSLAEMEKAHA